MVVSKGERAYFRGGNPERLYSHAGREGFRRLSEEQASHVAFGKCDPDAERGSGSAGSIRERGSSSVGKGGVEDKRIICRIETREGKLSQHNTYYYEGKGLCLSNRGGKRIFSSSQKERRKGTYQN